MTRKRTLRLREVGNLEPELAPPPECEGGAASRDGEDAEADIKIKLLVSNEANRKIVPTLIGLCTVVARELDVKNVVSGPREIVVEIHHPVSEFFRRETADDIGVGIGVVLLAVAVLGYVGFMGVGTYYYNVGEFLAKESTLGGQTVRVSGIVDQNNPPTKEGLTYRFTLLDVTNQNLKLAVVYNGATPPDTFKPGQQAVVEGKYDAASGIFKSTSIVVKCASKYQPATT